MLVGALVVIFIILLRRLIIQMAKSFANAFWGRAKRVGKCLEWQGMRNKDGYGVVSISGVPLLAHRVAHELTKGDAGNNLVCHTCDNPPCIEPEHLFKGTQKDNIQDALSKGRLNKKHGFGAAGGMGARAKDLLDLGLNVQEVARMLNLTAGYVRQIQRGDRQ